MVELDEVELAQLGQGRLVLTLGMRVLPILLVDSQPPCMQCQVRGPMPDQLAQLGVVDLAVLPPRGHHGHHGLRVEVTEDPRQVRARPGPHQVDLKAHVACTVIVRPTSSSI